MKAILTFQEGDERFIIEHSDAFTKYSDEKLVDAYNKEVKCGTVGVKAQTLYLFVLRLTMRGRFKASPIFLSPNNIMAM